MASRNGKNSVDSDSEKRNSKHSHSHSNSSLEHNGSFGNRSSKHSESLGNGSKYGDASEYNPMKDYTDSPHNNSNGRRVKGICGFCSQSSDMETNDHSSIGITSNDCDSAGPDSLQDRGSGCDSKDDRRQDRGNTTTDCLEGLVRTDDHGRRLVLLDGHTVYWRGHRRSTPPSPAGADDGRVKVMAGHRGGHYPAFACYVGPAMLDAAIVGPERGRQPSVAHILEAIRELDDGCGVLILVASETSARLNYGIAATKARSRGINVKLLAVGDDVVRCRAAAAGGNYCRRRGAAGTVLLCKVAGSLSAQGHNLSYIYTACRRLSLERVATVNAVIGKRPLCRAVDDAKDDKSVLLLGTDTNGRNEVRMLPTTDVAEMVSAVIGLLIAGNDDLHGDHQNFDRWRDADVVIMVNNLGGMSDVRFMAVVAEVSGQLATTMGVRAVHRWYTGRMLTSASHLDDGFSVTVMDVGVAAECRSSDAIPSQLLYHLDFPVSASGWSFAPDLNGNFLFLPPSPEYVRRYDQPLPDDDLYIPPSPTVPEDQWPFVVDVLTHVCTRIIEAEDKLNTMDAMDDGDCGSNWRRGAEALMSAVASGQINVTSPADLLHTISRILETRMAGTLGSLLSVMFMSFSQAFFKYPVNIVLGPAMWVDGLAQGTMAVKAYGMCQPGDRTLLDALVPAVRGMEIILRESKNPIHLLRRAVGETEAGCLLSGRAAVLRGGHSQSADAGAYGRIHLLRRAVGEAEAGCLLSGRAAVLRGGHSQSADAGAYGVKIVLEAMLEKYAQRPESDRRRSNVQ